MTICDPVASRMDDAVRFRGEFARTIARAREAGAKGAR